MQDLEQRVQDWGVLEICIVMELSELGLVVLFLLTPKERIIAGNPAWWLEWLDNGEGKKEGGLRTIEDNVGPC